MKGNDKLGIWATKPDDSYELDVWVHSNGNIRFTIPDTDWVDSHSSYTAADLYLVNDT
ncbi:hypothetical protein FRB94_004569 [Tulasnella sp. JGI-2019a]|nr:hypothetical protein FRB94_004569 [Tulasnella sp. JGI-2019a]